MMKKRNWVLEILLCTAICFIGFGIYMAQAQENGTFALEDIEGERSALAAFPLAGHGGDATTSFRFTIQDGELDTEYFSYGKNELEMLMAAEQYGVSGIKKYFTGTPGADEPWTDTMPIATEDVTLTMTETSSTYLLDDAEGIAGMPGLTLSMDAADIFCEMDFWHYLKPSIGGGWSGEWLGVRYDTGLTLRDKPYFYTMEGEETAWIQNNYANIEGESLQTYVAQAGDVFYAVTAPDARCEGQTYVYRLDFVEDRERDETGETAAEKLNQRATDRSTYGTVTPIISIADPAESMVVGLAGIEGKEWLLLYRVAGTTFYADLYDTTGRLLGGASTTLDEDIGNMGDNSYEYETFRIANGVETDVVCWEEGISVEIEVSGYLRAKKNDDAYGGMIVPTGEILLWIDAEGNLEQIDKPDSGRIIVRGDKMLCIGDEEIPEAEKLEKILGYKSNWTETLTVLERASGKTLYRGRLKTDFWQDNLNQLAEYNTAPKAGYLREQQVDVYTGTVREMELYLAGEWRGDRW